MRYADVLVVSSAPLAGRKQRLRLLLAVVGALVLPERIQFDSGEAFLGASSARMGCTGRTGGELGYWTGAGSRSGEVLERDARHDGKNQEARLAQPRGEMRV